MSAVRRWAIRLLPVSLGLALGGAAVWHASHSPFTTTTTGANTGSSIVTLGLTNDSTGALFTPTNLTPGQTGSRCLQVTSTGTAPSTVKIYATRGAAVPNDISPYIAITIQEGTGGTVANCSSFTPAATEYHSTLSTLTSTATSYATGVPGGTLTGTGLPEHLTYKITWTLSPATPNSAQGARPQT